MRRKSLMKVMRAAISDVLETMFFVTVEFAESTCTLKEWFSDKQLLFGATISFSGPSSGLLWLVAPVSALNEITANFLGRGKDEICDEEKRDTVKEALNMIGGHGFSLLGRKDTFALGIPSLIEGLTLIENMQGNSSKHTILIKAGQNRLAAGIGVD
jgi:hypothetical protein